MKNTVININAVKSLIPYSMGAVVHFCRTAVRCYGKVALREQLNYEEKTGVFSSFEMVEENRSSLGKEIVNLVNATGNSLKRLNEIAVKNGLTKPLPAIDTMTLTELMSALVTYVETLVDADTEMAWLKEFEDSKRF